MSTLNPQLERFGRYWRLDPNTVFLNHGSFGACPVAVLDAQSRWRDELEQEPVRFLTRTVQPLWDEARQRLAEFVGCDGRDLVFVPNATHGVNSVLRSLRFRRGDQILITSHTYNACANAARFVARRQRVKIVVVEIPFPIQTSDQVLDAVLAAVTSQTRLALLDHVTSPTSLVLPIQQLVRELSARGVETLVDGAHAPGMVPVELGEMAPTYYTANCHKWICAPKGSGFLFVQPDRQDRIHPLAISHGANSPRTDRSRFWMEFDWTGTHDPTPYLCVPVALDHISSLHPGGWPGIMQHNHRAAVRARHDICQKLALPIPCPDSMVGAMFTLDVPHPLGSGNTSQEQADRFHDRLLDEHGIQVIVHSFAGRLYFRVSQMLHNTPQDVGSLVRALEQICRSDAISGVRTPRA